MEEVKLYLDQIRSGQLELCPGTPYDIKQLEAFIASGVPLSEIYSMYVPYPYHVELDRFYELLQKEHIDWNDTINVADTCERRVRIALLIGQKIDILRKAKCQFEAFKHRWIDQMYYDEQHLSHADNEIQSIGCQIDKLTEKLYHKLYQDMKCHPWIYSPASMYFLFEGIDDAAIQACIDNYYRAKDDEKFIIDFVCSGNTIKLEDLKKEGIIPQDFTRKRLVDPDYGMVQPEFKDLGDYPINRKDIFFLGVPRSGKSSVLAGILYAMRNQSIAEYTPQLVEGKDVSAKYRNRLMDSVAVQKYSGSTGSSTVCFMKYNIHKDWLTFLTHIRIPVNFVELPDSVLLQVGSSQNDSERRERYEHCGLKQCFESPNKKVLFLLLDYAVIKGIYDGISLSEQLYQIEKALTVFMQNGTGLNPGEDCTMSKVKTIAIVMTKCDLMEGADTLEQRREVAEQYVQENCQSLVNRLDKAHACYNVNVRNKQGRLNIIPFSMGKQYIGNTYDYDITYSNNLIQFLRDHLD